MFIPLLLDNFPDPIKFPLIILFASIYYENNVYFINQCISFFMQPIE
jgi:hypothetical protein